MGRVIANAIGVVVVGLMSRSLGPEGFGEYNAIFAYLFLFNVLADMGLYTLLLREISKEGSDEAHITSTMLTLRLLLVLASALLASGLVYLLPYTPVVRWGVFVGSISIVCSSLVQLLMGVFQKYLKLSLVAIADVATRIIQLLLIAWVIAYSHATVVSFVWIAVIAGVAQLGLTLVFARGLTPLFLRIDLPYWKKTLRTAFPIAVSLLFVLLYFKIDTVMLSLMKSPFDVGVYAIGYKVLEIIIFFPAMYVGLVMPVLSRVAERREEFTAELRKAATILFWGAVPTVAGLILFAPLIVRLVSGPGFEAAVPVIRILSFAIAIIFFGNLGGNALIALDIQKQGMWIYGAGAVFNILLNLLLIPRYSYYAASWVTVATELLVTVGMFLLIRNKLVRE